MFVDLQNNGYGIPVEMRETELEKITVDPDIARSYPVSFLRRHGVFPLYRDTQGVTVFAIADPRNALSVGAVRMSCEGRIGFVACTEEQTSALIDAVFVAKNTDTAIKVLSSDRDTKQSHSATDKQSSYHLEDAPAVILVDSLIKEALQLGASDIHIEPYEDGIRVRYRIDGELSDRATLPVFALDEICARIKIMAEMDIAEKRLPQDGHIVIREEGREYDLRVSTLPTVNGEKFVLRILDKSRLSFTRSQIGFDCSDSELIDKILSSPHGIILLTGPTGCGKSTTLYAFLNEINKNSINIVTVEDPVEYTMKGINQTQINPKIDLTFAGALRSILRQDPDVIMVGEIRDEETAQIATRAAITGHLVFSTLHTNDAPGAVTRLADMGVSPYLVADSVVAVISQRLVKKLCPNCKKEKQASQREKMMLGVSQSEPCRIFSACGCSYCSKTGYRGRTAVHEIMYMNEELRSTVSQGKTAAKEIRKIALQNGMRELSVSCARKVLDGTTDIREYLKFCADNELEV